MSTITIWPFYDAPQELQDISTHGGDEDVLCVLEGDTSDLPWQLTEVFNLHRTDKLYRDYMPAWGFVQRETLPDGRILVICAHS